MLKGPKQRQYASNQIRTWNLNLKCGSFLNARVVQRLRGNKQDAAAADQFEKLQLLWSNIQLELGDDSLLEVAHALAVLDEYTQRFHSIAAR